jgi:uncharacterized protein (DUF1697 family)
MTTWIVLIRGINVGGKQLLPMKSLAAILEKDGFTHVRTYIQSGNVVLQSAQGTASSIGERIGAPIRDAHGFQPKVLVLSAQELRKAARENPFPVDDAQGKSVHLFFLDAVPEKADLQGLAQFKVGNEAFALKGKVFYLHTPEGFGTSKLVQKIGRFIDGDMTARNWNTVRKLIELSGST